jgi:hypothetical protein
LAGECEKHADVIKSIGDIEGRMSTCDSVLNTIQKDIKKNEDTIKEVSAMHSILAEVKS